MLIPYHEWIKLFPQPDKHQEFQHKWFNPLSGNMLDDLIYFYNIKTKSWTIDISQQLTRNPFRYLTRWYTPRRWVEFNYNIITSNFLIFLGNQSNAYTIP